MSLQMSIATTFRLAWDEISTNLDVGHLCARSARGIYIENSIFGKVGVSHDRACKYFRRLSSRCSDFFGVSARALEIEVEAFWHSPRVSLKPNQIGHDQNCRFLYSLQFTGTLGTVSANLSQNP